MSHLSEGEILDMLKTSLGEAIQASKDLAVKSRIGQPYSRLRDNLAYIEGCCRQMAAFRGDARWLPFGIAMATCHQKSGAMLRGHLEGGIFIPWSPGVINKNFLKLAAELQVIADFLKDFYMAKTGTSGPILPATPAAERRVGAPVSNSGLILPPSMRHKGEVLH